MEEFANNLTSAEIAEIGRKAYPLECSPAHGVTDPALTLIATEQDGIYFYEFYKDSDGLFFYKEYVCDKETGRMIPYDEAIFAPIRAAAEKKRRAARAEADLRKREEREKDLLKLRRRLAGIKDNDNQIPENV